MIGWLSSLVKRRREVAEEERQRREAEAGRRAEEAQQIREAEARRRQEEQEAEAGRREAEEQQIREAKAKCLEEERRLLAAAQAKPADGLSHLLLARFYASKLKEWEKEWEEVKKRYPDEWTKGGLMRKAASSYLSAIAVGFPSKQTAATARVEYVLLFDLSSYALSWMREHAHGFTEEDLQALRNMPSPDLYAREAEQILRQLLKIQVKIQRDALDLWELLLRAVVAQRIPRSQANKIVTIEARIAEIKTRQALQQAAKGNTGLNTGHVVSASDLSSLRDAESEYGADWPELSRQARERDGWRCSECGSREDLDVHHIIPLSQGGTNDMDNLITLCRNCHANIHPHMSTDLP